MWNEILLALVKIFKNFFFFSKIYFLSYNLIIKEILFKINEKKILIQKKIKIN
jgi:hypothetical protein